MKHIVCLELQCGLMVSIRGWGWLFWKIYKNYIKNFIGGARGLMAIVLENGHGDKSSNPGRD